MSKDGTERNREVEREVEVERSREREREHAKQQEKKNTTGEENKQGDSKKATSKQNQPRVWHTRLLHTLKICLTKKLWNLLRVLV